MSELLKLVHPVHGIVAKRKTLKGKNSYYIIQLWKYKYGKKYAECEVDIDYLGKLLYTMSEKGYSPTRSDILLELFRMQMWLLEEKRITVAMFPVYIGDAIQWQSVAFSYDLNRVGIYSNTYPGYLQALQAAIESALNFL